jgi:hypothetical protein
VRHAVVALGHARRRAEDRHRGARGIPAGDHRKAYKYARPQIEAMPWGRDLSVRDPFGNRLTFASR